MPELYDSVAKKTYPFKDIDEIYIGRGVSVDNLRIVETFPRISKSHAKVSRKQGKFYIQDLQSGNGTWLDKVRLKPNDSKLLNDRSRIDLAEIDYYPIVFYEGERPEPEMNDSALLDLPDDDEDGGLSDDDFFKIIGI